MTVIKAAVCRGFGTELQIEELTLRPPGTREVEVTLEAVAICHSDISFASGAWGGDLPAVYGHEAAGRISALGDGVGGFCVGDRVVVTLVRACGSCANCCAGRPTTCVGTGDVAPKLTDGSGAPVVAAMDCGAFAERVVVDSSQIVHLPDTIPAQSGALLACGVITGVGAVINAGRLRPGEDVVVIGAGGVGLNAIQGAAIAGARRIVAVDLNAEKLDAARAFGATHGVLASAEAPWSDAMNILGGKGADVVAVSVGAIAAYNDAQKYLGYGGRLVMIGMPPSDALAAYEPVVNAFMSSAMIGSKMGDVVIRRDIPWLTDLYAQGRLMLDELVSGLWRLDEINAAISDTRGGAARRNVILFDTP